MLSDAAALQDRPADESRERSRGCLGAGLGWTADPDGFLPEGQK